jgi:DNA-binding NarL/FixJ family response regulator
MPSDHVVEVVEELPKEDADKILDLMEEEKSEEVQDLLEKGCSPKEIACDLHLSHKTVYAHRDQIKKLLLRQRFDSARSTAETHPVRPAK